MNDLRLVFDNNAATAYWSFELEMIMFEWHGWLDIDSTKEVIEQAKIFVNKKRVLRELHNLTGVKADFTMIINWVDVAYVTALNKYGRKIALVYPSDVFARYSIKLAHRMLSGQAVKSFNEIDSAIKWIEMKDEAKADFSKPTDFIGR